MLFLTFNQQYQCTEGDNTECRQSDNGQLATSKIKFTHPINA